MRTPIYLDHAAATPLDERVFAAMQPFFAEHFYNPSAPYMPAKKVRDALDDARHRLAVCIGGARDEIIMTAGATESVNLAFRGLLEPNDHVVFGATEHAAVRAVAVSYPHTAASSDAKGSIRPEVVRAVVTDKTKLVSVTAADSELGTIQTLSKIAAVLDEIRLDRMARGVTTPLYLHSDASQAAGVIDLHVSRLGVDLLTLSAAKCYGPKQVGLLWVSSRVVLRPIIMGGGQERGLRSGTENVAGAVGFATALELAIKRRHQDGVQLKKRRDKLQQKLTTAIPGLVVNGSEKKRLPGHLHVSLDGLDAERVVFNLDMKGVLVATGAACAANSGTRSQVLLAAGLTTGLADGSLRISIGRHTTGEEIELAAGLIAQAITEERGRS